MEINPYLFSGHLDRVISGSGNGAVTRSSTQNGSDDNTREQDAGSQGCFLQMGLPFAIGNGVGGFGSRIGLGLTIGIGGFFGHWVSPFLWLS